MVYFTIISNTVIFGFFTLILVLFRKSLLSKVYINEWGIRLKYKNLVIKEVKWSDIVEIKLASTDRNRSMVIFLPEKLDDYTHDYLYFNIDKKILATIKNFCNNKEILELMINNKLTY